MELSPHRGSTDELFRGKSAISHAWDVEDSLCITTPPVHISTRKAVKVRLWNPLLLSFLGALDHSPVLENAQRVRER